MKLPFGIHQGKFVHISEVSSGKTAVHCPYCDQNLIAKKGRIKRHHFAHDGVGCAQNFSHHFFDLVGKLPTKLPLSVYACQKQKKIDKFLKKLELQVGEIKQKKSTETELLQRLRPTLQQLSEKDTSDNISEISAQVDRYLSNKIAPFPEFHLIRSEEFSEGYTDGKGVCSSSNIHQDRYEFYYPVAFSKYVTFLKNYHQQNFDEAEMKSKLDLFQKDLIYFNKFTLYFVEIDADFQKIYKIGLTSRPIKLRLAEITNDLKNYFLEVALNLRFEQKGVAFLETFFKQKYNRNQLKLGSLTEYFTFSKLQVLIILKDLNLLQWMHVPARNHTTWIDWVYFNFNGKIYGHLEKSVYIDNVKYILTEFEEKQLLELLHIDEQCV